MTVLRYSSVVKPELQGPEPPKSARLFLAVAAGHLVVTGSAPSRSLRTYVLGNISREIVNRANCATLAVRGHN